MTMRIPSLPRQQVNWWAISAGIVMVGYACIAGVVFVLWGAVGFFVPGIDCPHSTLAQQDDRLSAFYDPNRIPERWQLGQTMAGATIIYSK